VSASTPLVDKENITLLEGYVEDNQKNRHVALRIKFNDRTYFVEVSLKFWFDEENINRWRWFYDDEEKEEKVKFARNGNVYEGEGKLKYKFTVVQEISDDVGGILRKLIRNDLSNDQEFLEKLISCYNRPELIDHST
jgi:hypothetical protein